ncbi:MAG: hypothetical protein IPH57_00705 [Saprospiraceae bacterium]|nr:hypothetical protein [Saprospiraceae bacterium]
MIKIEDLIAFFFSESKISFPGFGTLILERQEAKRNPVKNKIFGPKYTTNFLYNEYDDKSISMFLEFYSKKNKIDILNSDNDLRKLSIDILNNIATTDTALLDGFGTFFKKSEGICFEFSPVLNELLEKSNPDFPLLIMNRQEVAEPSEEIAEENNESIQISSPKKSYNLVGPALISLAVLSFLCFLICALNIFNTRKPEIAMVPVPTDSVSETEASPAYTNDSEMDDLSVFEEKAVSDITVTDNAPQEKTTKPVQVQKTIIQSGNRKNASLDALISKSEENRNLFNNTCIIIAGSFQSRSNAIKILDRIRSNGFEPYAEIFNGNYRIGTISDMSEVTPENHLISVKNKIEKNSWILQPKQD